MARKNKNNRQLTAQQALGLGLVQSNTTAFIGPLPPPQVLAEYNSIVPDAAERIISMAEKQSDHRMTLETIALSAEIKRADRGLGVGAVICLAFLGVAGTLVALGHDIAGASLGGGSLASIAGIFVIGTSAQRAERKARIEMLTGHSRQ